MRSRGIQLSSFKLKLVAYFVLLSLVPLAATYWGFSTVAGAGESRQVTLRQEAGLRAALALYAEQADQAQRRLNVSRAPGRFSALSSDATAGRCGSCFAGAVALRRRHRRPSRRLGAASRCAIPGRRRRRHAAPGRGRGDDPARRPSGRASPARSGLRLGRRSRPSRRKPDHGLVAVAARKSGRCRRAECDRPRGRHALSRIRRPWAARRAGSAARRPDPQGPDRRGRRTHP